MTLIKTIITVFLLSYYLLAQDILIQQLDSSSVRIRQSALWKIEEDSLVEYTTALENRIFIQSEPFMIIDYLHTLEHLRSIHLYDIALGFIQKANDFPNMYPPEDPLPSKVNATRILFSYNDFSTVNYVFEIIERDRPQVDKNALDVLVSMLNKTPQYEDSSKQILLGVIYNCPDNFTRYYTLDRLYNKYKAVIVDHITNRFVNDNYLPVRSKCLEYLSELDYSGLNSILNQRLTAEPEWTLRLEIAMSLLKKFGAPSDLKKLINNQPLEQDETARSLMGFAIRDFVPPRPLNSTSVSDMVSNLISTTDTLFNYNWLGDLTFTNSLKSKLGQAKTYLLAGDSLSCAVQVKAFQDDVNLVYKDSLNPDPRFVTIEGWKFLYWNAQYILDRLPEPPANTNLVVSLKSSAGTLLTTGSLQYYEGSWKDAVSNGDGTFTVITNQNNVSLRMTYEYAQQKVNNIPAHNNTYIFQTVSANVQLRNSQGSLIDTGTVQYYAGAWRNFGTTTNGVATRELLPINYSFRMTYEYASIDKQQNLSTDPTVVFQTVNATVQLKNSLGNMIDQGTVQYYAGAWRSFGTTTNGVAAKELLPINYSFRMTHEFLSKDKQQNVSTNPVVDFQTVLCTVKVSNTNNQPISNSNVKYYAGAWRDLGVTNIDGITTKELLPQNISFRATSGSVSADKQQDIGVNSLVEILLNIP